jgi:hypothetical protein
MSLTPCRKSWAGKFEKVRDDGKVSCFDRNP